MRYAVECSPCCKLSWIDFQKRLLVKYTAKIITYESSLFVKGMYQPLAVVLWIDSEEKSRLLHSLRIIEFKAPLAHERPQLFQTMPHMYLRKI